MTEALDLAFDVIDNDSIDEMSQIEVKPKTRNNNHSPTVIGLVEKIQTEPKSIVADKPIYPKIYAIPIIEMNKPNLTPPKEKPPPPPPDDSNDELDDDPLKAYESKFLKRNGTNSSTRRIQTEIKNKRNSFLGFEDANHEYSDYELIQFGNAQNHRYENVDVIENNIENHSRQNSDSTWSSDDFDQCHSKSFTDNNFSLEHDKKLLEIGKNALMNENSIHIENDNYGVNDVLLNNRIDEYLDDGDKLREIEEQFREDEEIWRVERELRQLESEEMKRKQTLEANRLLRQKQLESIEYHRSLQDIHNNIYVNVQPERHPIINSRKSMPNLQDAITNNNDVIKMKQLTASMPPAKPLRAQEYAKLSQYFGNYSNENTLDQKSKSYEDFNVHPTMSLSQSQSQNNMLWLRPSIGGNEHNAVNTGYYDVPRSIKKFTPQIVPHDNPNAIQIPSREHNEHKLNQQKRKSDPTCYNYNKHWLIQEAEQRRIDQERSTRSRENDLMKKSGYGKNMSPLKEQKALPETIIQTLTERVRNRLEEKKR